MIITLIQASGEAEYLDTQPPLPGELSAQLVHSPLGNATISSIDPSAALVSYHLCNTLFGKEVVQFIFRCLRIMKSIHFFVFCTICRYTYRHRLIFEVYLHIHLFNDNIWWLLRLTHNMYKGEQYSTLLHILIYRVQSTIYNSLVILLGE